MDVDRVRADFPILERKPHGRQIVYLDSANTSQKPRQVIDTVSEYYANHNANLYRAVYELAEEATAMFETARMKLAGFIGAPDPTTVVFNRGTTESINLVAHGWGRRFLKQGDEVLLTDMEHHSNIVPWQLAANATGAMLRYMPLTEDGSLDLTDLESLLTERTKVFAITGQSNVLGTLPPLRELASAAHAVGAIVVVDGAQLVPHNPVDVIDLGIDFLTISGHKMLGPTASGGLYGKRELLDAMDPFFGGGEMIMEVFPEHSTYKEPPHKFEAGTMNIAQEIGLAAAIEYLGSLGMDAVREHEKQLTAYAIGRLEDAGAVVHGPKDVQVRGGAVSFWFKDIHPHDLAQVLDQEGVCVRASHHCAQILMRRLGVPATTRASFYVYNTMEEVDALVDALARAESVFA
ncbi:MAG: cysteine desulfurase [Actinomycetota bacterium]|nr:cysteine desulfurase [Actinomycetota bacterium]